MKRVKQFRTWGIITIVATIFLIWVGGLVRATGAGMGCPDWPKCFDCWVPPTDSLGLPADYRAHYVALREKKNSRVAKTLAHLGMNDVAQKILNDSSVHDDEPFNAVKTWIEYLNRLVGVLVGFFIFITTILAWRLRQANKYPIPNTQYPNFGKRIFLLSLLGFIGVGFEGWLGSIVVSTNLMPGFITVHMIVALLVLLVLISAVLCSYQLSAISYQQKTLRPEWANGNRIGQRPILLTGIIVCVLVSAQIIMGTQVRQQVDAVAKILGENQRANWIAHLSGVYNVHKYFYYLIALATAYWFWQLRAYFNSVGGVRILSFSLVGLLLCEIIFGISMNNLGIPAILQPFHLLFGILIFSTAYTLVVRLRKNFNS